MSSSRVQRHREQQAKLAALRGVREELAPYRVSTETTGGDEVASPSSMLDAFTRAQDADMVYLRAPVCVSAEEAGALLDELRARWDGERLAGLLGGCRTSVLQGIALPFGLGAVVAAGDKAGGNVTTVHNAQNDVYARDEDAYQRKEYAGADYKAARDAYADAKIKPNSQMVQDEYSGDFIDYSQADCDHIYSAKRYHQDGGFMQSKEQKKAFGSDPDNFALTSDSANRSKSDKHFDEWHPGEATDGSGRSNKERHGHDGRRVNPAVARGQRTAQKHAPKTADKMAYYGERALATGGAEAGKMGLQQSLGLLLIEFLTASFDEIIDMYKHGLHAGAQDDGFFAAVKVRLERIAVRVAATWKGAVIAFKDGAISGFLSNLVTMLVNMLVTTGKRIVRMIRDGMMAILAALKMALFPPKGMTRAQAGDAAIKLLGVALTTSLGLLAEELVEKSVTLFFTTHMPLLAPFAPSVAVVIVATMTGVASALLVYWLDHLDLFGVRMQREHAAILLELDAAIGEGDLRINQLYDSEMGRLRLG